MNSPRDVLQIGCRRPLRLAMMALTFVSLAGGCGLDPGRVAKHHLFADDGEQLRSAGAVSFVVVGNLRSPSLVDDRILHRRAAHDGIVQEVVGDITRQLDERQIGFVVLMGDDVRMSSTREWRRFDSVARNLLDGDTFPDSPTRRVPVIPVVGNREYRSDRLLKGLDASFPGVGANIGYNRVGSWSTFDLQVQDTSWRFLVLDSNKKALRGRWDEQLHWIPQTVKGDDYDNLLVFMHHPLITLATKSESNSEGAPAELLDAVDENIGLMKMRAVFSADPATSEAYMVGGRYGTLHVNAGGGGAPAEDLQRWGAADAAGVEVAKLEPIFDLALINTFNKQIEEQGFPETVIDAARAEGSYTGFPGMFDARFFPLYGYWILTLRDDHLEVVFRMWSPEDGFQDIYQADFLGDEGWRTGS